MALADILAFIAEEANGEKASILSQAKEEAKRITEEYAKKAEMYRKNRESSLHTMEESHTRAYRSALHKMERSEQMSMEAELLDTVFRGVFEKLQNLSEGELQNFCEKLLQSLPETEGKIISFGTSVSVLKDSVAKLGKKFEVEEGKGTGGFIFQGKEYSVDFSFETLVHKELRKKQEAEIFQFLFS